MKKNPLLLILILIVSALFKQADAQSGYTYTLIDNGSYSYSVSAIPDISTSNFPTSVQSYGFTILVPDGITVTITSSFGPSAGATFFDGTAVGMPAFDGYLITEALSSPMNMPAPSSGTITPMATFTVNGSPISGELILLANDSGLATTITALKHFLTADMEDDGSAMYSNRTPEFASGLSGTIMYSFSTLGIEKVGLTDFRVYPNPATDHVYIKGSLTNLNAVKIYSVTGKLVSAIIENLETLNIGSLKSGVYILELHTKNDAVKIIKLIKI